MISDIESPRTACRYYHNGLDCNPKRLIIHFELLLSSIDFAGSIGPGNTRRSYKLAPLDVSRAVFGLEEQTSCPEMIVLQSIISSFPYSFSFTLHCVSTWGGDVWGWHVMFTGLKLDVSQG